MKRHFPMLTKEAERGVARSCGICAAATLCVCLVGKEEHADKPIKGQFTSSFSVIFILFIAGCDQA